MVDYSAIKLNESSFDKLPARLRYNGLVADYYRTYADELKHDNFSRDYFERLYKNADLVENCSKYWEVDYYRLQRVKSLEKVNLCRDKFCVNCQSVLANARLHKFEPIIKDVWKTNKIFHCVFTVENCKGFVLKNVIKKMYKSFGYFVRYLNGRAKIRGLKFDYLGFKGGVRSLELTYNKEDDTYHPHFHCLLAFSKNLNLDKKFLNKFSYSKYSDEVRYFSQEEILFQKIWYLLNIGEKVNRANIDNVELGYSVACDEAKETDMHEVFKYALKADFDRDVCLGFEQFKLYRESLLNLRIIQGYGNFLNYEFETNDFSAVELDVAIQEYKAQLRLVENPVRVYEQADTLVDNIKSGKWNYITSGSIKKFVLEDIR